MPRDQAELGKQFSAYADAITAFTFVQSLAFGVALGSNDTFRSRALGIPWLVPGIIVVANLLYACLVYGCHRGEDELLEPFPSAGAKWQKRVRVGRMVVIGLGLALSLLAYGATWNGSRHLAPQSAPRCLMGKP